ncbi:MAG: hypothetical protein ACPGSB_04735 [Opitutales bacterium]
MKPDLEASTPPEVSAQARRAKQIIVCVMALFMLLPLLLAWATGSIQF